MKFFNNLSKKKKIILLSCLIVLILALIVLILFFVFKNKENVNVKEYEEINNVIEESDEEVDNFVYDPSLTKPEVTTGQRGELGIDKNINESNIDDYLNRTDSVYRDMRMLEDPANYENIQGNRILDGFINGFEVVPLPYILPVTNLPKEVGNTYSGNTLFHVENGVYVANYEESLSIIEELFPKDKYIFLMCGGGGYAGMMKEFLVSMGWHADRIYNVGGFWYYNGKNKVDTVVGAGFNGIDYNFDIVPYHNIDFDKLTKASSYVIPDYKVEDLESITSYVKVEKGMSFQAKVLVLPNEAKNKDLIWESSDSSIATVDKNGLIKGVRSGYTSILVKSKEDPNKYVYLHVVVTQKEYFGKVSLSDVSEEQRIFAENDPEALLDEFYNTIESNRDNSIYYKNGIPTDAYLDASRDYKKREDIALSKRIDTFKKMMEEKKTFIVLINSKDCGDDFRVIDSAEKILKNSNIPYFYTYDEVSGIDTSFVDSVSDKESLIYGVVVIVKDGEVSGVLRRDYDSVKSDDEVKTWLSNYIDLK